MSQPDSKRPKTDKTDKKREFDVAVRAAKRGEWIGSCYEIKYLEEQVDTIEHIRRVAPLEMDEELDLIIQQLHQKAARDRSGAARNANNSETFTCCICMDRQPLAHLHVNVPCGHGFCKTCIGKTVKPGVWHGPHAAPPAATPECYTCRAKVASVLKTFV